MKFSQIINRKNATLLAFAGLCFGLFYSRVVLSNAMILIAAIALLNRNFFHDLKAFVKRKDLMLLSGVFLLYALSGIISEDQREFLIRLRVKIPFAFFPLAFTMLPNIERKYLNAILALFVLFAFSGIAYPGYHYLLNPDLYNELYGRGQVMPTPINHIRFSVLLAIAFFIAFYLAKYWQNSKKHFLSFSFLFIGIIIFLFLHILAVRSGLLGLYLGGVVFIFYYFRNKWKLQILALLGIVLSIFIALQLSPTLNAKWNYMKYDIEGMIAKKKYSGYSDSGRIISILAGIETAMEKPIFGHGIGDIRSSMEKIYRENYTYITEDKRMKPHNQFIYVLVGMGCIGMLYLTISLLAPVFSNGNYKFTLFFIIQLIFFSSFLTEAPLEEQIGVGSYLFFTLFFIHYKSALISQSTSFEKCS